MTDRVIHKGKLITLRKEKVDLDNGGHTYFDIVKHPGGAVIAALNENNEICLLSQWRHAVKETIWELPAGCLEIGEPPMQTAKRELEEEAGVIAKIWRELGKIYPSPGFSDEVLYLFEAKDISKGTLKLDAAEKLEAHWLPLEKVLTMAKNGEIVDAKSLACLLKLHK